MKVALQKGARITCVNEHFICYVVRDIGMNEEVMSDQFSGWTQEPPKSGDTNPESTRCQVCGAPWYRAAIYENSEMMEVALDAFHAYPVDAYRY